MRSKEAAKGLIGMVMGDNVSEVVPDYAHYSKESATYEEWKSMDEAERLAEVNRNLCSQKRRLNPAGLIM